VISTTASLPLVAHGHDPGLSTRGVVDQGGRFRGIKDFVVDCRPGSPVSDPTTWTRSPISEHACWAFQLVVVHAVDQTSLEG
jgi:hypothetical protein